MTMQSSQSQRGPSGQRRVMSFSERALATVEYAVTLQMKAIEAMVQGEERASQQNQDLRKMQREDFNLISQLVGPAFDQGYAAFVQRWTEQVWQREMALLLERQARQSQGMQ